MPSTYSPSLRLELMGAGEQAANWNNTTNYNLGTLLEQAISGVESVSVSGASYTLTTGSGVADEARNAVLELTGTLTANCNLIVPSVDKTYTFRNATTGGFNVVVKTAAGSGVAILNGFTQQVYCDSTNVVLASVPVNSTNGDTIVTGSLYVVGSIGTGSTGGGNILPPGIIWEYGGSAAPAGWLLCNGAAVSRSVYSALFAVIGTAYGAGDGSTTFNLPNRTDRFGVGAGGSYARGSTGGAASATTSSNGSHNHTSVTGGTALTEAQMPSHSHPGLTSTDGAHSHGNIPQAVGDNDRGTLSSAFSIDNFGSTDVQGLHNHSVITEARGGNQPHNHSISTDGTHSHTVTTIPPYVASNYIIKT